MTEDRDLLIIGAGAAGLSAAIYAARRRARVAAFTMPGVGRLAKAGHIETYLGFPEPIPGPELLARGMQQARNFGAEIIEKEIVNARINADGKFVLQAADGTTYPGQALVIATGAERQTTGVPGEAEFYRKGVHECVLCDGPLYAGEAVAFIGSGNLAATEALEMTEFTERITVFTHGLPLEMDPALRERLRAHQIPILHHKITAFRGGDFLTGLELDSGEVEPVAAAFLTLGSASALRFATALGLDMDQEMRYIAVDRETRTNVRGVFAAGDVTGKPLQIATAVGDGCRAALAALEYIKERGG